MAVKAKAKAKAKPAAKKTAAKKTAVKKGATAKKAAKATKSKTPTTVTLRNLSDAIAEAHDGTLVAGSGPLGGLLLRLELPRVTEDGT